MVASAPVTPRVNSDDLEMFTRQLGVLLSAGVDMLRALEVASQQTGSARLMAVGRGIAATMSDGREFHDALSRYPDVFSPFYVQMARRGELDGVLGPTLLAVSDYLLRESGRMPASPNAFALSAAYALGAPPHPRWGRLVAAPMLALAGSALGAGMLWGLGVMVLVPPDWIGALAIAWTGICLIAGAMMAWWAPQPKRRQVPTIAVCSLCGRNQKSTGDLHQGHGISICDACLRSTVEQLKPAETGGDGAAAPASSPPPAPEALAGSTGLQSPAAPSVNGVTGDDGTVSNPPEKRINLG
jgi:hypothetical protein